MSSGGGSSSPPSVEGMDEENAASEQTLSLGVRQFVTARVAEIASLTAQISAGGGAQGRGKGFSFQHVSKHMRRRAVSHNPKRLPSRLRNSHLSQLRKSSGGVVKKPKRPRRKYRKRSDGDILEYNRRQLVNPKWLESHIWHAKRFHMKSAWDRKLAIAPTAKCFRSLFRAARQNVIMHDISYLEVLEISGPISVLVEGINTIVPDGFPRVPIWNREILVHVVSPSLSTYIGPIKCIWVQLETPSLSKLLIWLHPAIQSHVVQELSRQFELVEQNVTVDFPEFPTKDEQKYLWKITGNQCWSNLKTSVTLKELNGHFNRIRLVGHKTLAILKEILKFGQTTLSESVESTLKEQQKLVWAGVGKIVNVPDCTVIPLNVVDPRRELPDKRCLVKQTIKTKPESVNVTSQWQEFKQDSLLWREDVRRKILHDKTSDDLLSRSRSKNLIPGTTINDEKEPNVVPIALVFRSRLSSFPGVDLILPCGWLMPFWISLSYRCVRSFALEFNDYLTFEEDPHLLDFSTSTLFSPDSVVYAQETQKTEKEDRAKYFSYPPAKRQNFIKLGCAFPFSTSWTTFLRYLLKQVEPDMSVNVQVVRKREDLLTIANCLSCLKPNHPIFNSSDQLFPVQVVLLSGTVQKGACISLPTQKDLELFSSGQHNDVHIIQEPMKDSNAGKRAELNRQHHKRLSHLRKKRKVARRAALGGGKEFDLKSRLTELDSKSDVKKYNEEMNNLWLNDNVQEVLSKQDREIMGFTEYSHYSFVRGKAAGAGYITVGSLKRLIEVYGSRKTNVKGKWGFYVLVRNWASSLTYHWAKLEYPKSL